LGDRLRLARPGSEGAGRLCRAVAHPLQGFRHHRRRYHSQARQP
jgi:hypothetical protein